jgi:magnesium-transporting ATPase (P-type)
MTIDLTEYKNISRILFLSMGLNVIIVISLHYLPFDNFLSENFGYVVRLAIEQFFYGSLAATIACSIFLSKDKEINELEAIKPNPDPKELRLPDIIDKRLYIQRILSSGFLSVFGMFIILFVFNYLDVNTKSDFSFKQQLLIGIFSFMVGLYQSKFLSNIEKFFDNFTKSKISGKK